MRIIYLFLMSLFSVSIAAQSKNADTLYLKVSLHEISYKTINSRPLSGYVNIFFTLKGNFVSAYTVSQGFSFSFYAPIKADKSTRYKVSFIKKDEIEALASSTVDDFRSLLKNEMFVRKLAINKITIFLLLDNGSGKVFEMYPVKVATDLSSEG